MSICVYLYVCPLAHLRNHMSRLHRNFLYMLTVAVAQCSNDDSAIHNVLPVLWTSCLLIIGQADATPVGCILKVIHQGAAPGTKSDVYDCHV